MQVIKFIRVHAHRVCHEFADLEREGDINEATRKVVGHLSAQVRNLNTIMQKHVKTLTRQKVSCRVCV